MAGRWRYAVPNLLTCASICLGLLAISQATTGALREAAWLILLCVLLDKADGTAARLLKATSAFGVQLDSLADLVTFGVAPAQLVQAALLGSESRAPHFWPGFAYAVNGGTFLYAISCALRLAKFNVVADAKDRFFFGIPTTLCGGLVCSFLLSADKYSLGQTTYAALPILMVILALLMVSRLPLPKLVRRKSRIANAFQGVNVVLVYGSGLLRVYPEYLLTVATGYLCLGSAYGLISSARER